MKQVVVYDSKIKNHKSKARAAVWLKSDKEVLVKYFGGKEDALMNALWVMSRCRMLLEEMEVFYKGETIFYWKKHH